MNYKGNRHLQWEDRLTIERMLKIKVPKAKIAESLNVCLKTIYNEIARGMCEQLTSEYEFVQRYCPDVAERKYQENLRAKGPEIKLGNDYAFADKLPVISKIRLSIKNVRRVRHWRNQSLMVLNLIPRFVKLPCITGYIEAISFCALLRIIYYIVGKIESRIARVFQIGHVWLKGKR